MKLLPPVLVDRLPVDWWSPGNLRSFAGIQIHFCDENHVRSIELNGHVVAHGKKLFPYGNWD